MADPLSIASSVAGLVTITTQIAVLAKALYTSIKDAPESIQKIEREMDDMHLVFCQVQLFIAGTKKRLTSNSNRLTMISLHHLMATLSGCVLVCSNLDKKIAQVAGIRGAVGSTHSLSGFGTQLKERVKWALWKEDEAAEVIEDLQRHKLSLSLMLNIIQCNNSSEVAENLVQLHSVVAQILDSNRAISCQLRELIKRQDMGVGTMSISPTGAISLISEPGTNSSNVEMPSSARAVSPDPQAPPTFINTKNHYQDTDTKSIRSTSTSIVSTRSIASFTTELKNSRVYKRLASIKRGSSQSSMFSLDSTATKRDGWSMLSDMSLGGLPISVISVLELPIIMSDLHDPKPYLRSQRTPNQRRVLANIQWASRGRLHNAIQNSNIFLVRTFLNLGADTEEVYQGKTPLCFLITNIDHRTSSLPVMEMCKELINRGAVVDSLDDHGRTPLSYAALSRAPSIGYSIARLLLDHGAQIDSLDKTGRSPLSYAAILGRDTSPLSALGQLQTCTLFLDRGAQSDLFDSLGRTPLSYAAQYSTLEVCKVLVDRGARIDLCDSLGRTPLSYAGEYSTVQVCKLFLDSGAVLESIDTNGRNVLSYAAQSCGYLCTKICALFLSHGALINRKDFKHRTPIFYIANSPYPFDGRYKDPTDVCKLFLENGAEVDVIDSAGRTPLSYIAGSQSDLRGSSHSTGHLGICKQLLDAGANVNSTDFNGRSPLSYAASQARSVERCNLLLDYGAQVNCKDSTGRTPLSYAVSNLTKPHHIDVVTKLLRRKAEVNSQDFTNYTPLLYAVRSSFFNNQHSLIVRCDKLYCALSAIKLLLNWGAHIDPIDQAGRTPLSYAVQFCESTHIPELLLGSGAKVDMKDYTGRTPLSYAVQSTAPARTSICLLLIAKRAKVNSRDSTGRTPFSYAAQTEPHVCRLLLARGACINVEDSSGRTPLSYAAEFGRNDICKLILDEYLYRRNVNEIASLDSTARSPLMYAEQGNHHTIVELFRKTIAASIKLK